MIAAALAPVPSAVRLPPRRALLEQARLAAVCAYHLVAPRRRQSLDRVAEAAARACGAPAAAISLVGEHTIEFAGLYGMDQRQAARRFSLCDGVVAAEAPLLVHDAALIPGNCEHALVCFGGVRAYAGVPLIDADGYAVGAVCAMSPEPGALDAAPFADLAALAHFSESLFSPELEPEPEVRQAAGRGWLGVKTKRAHRDGSNRPGAIVLRVARQSPAERAGLRPADVIHSIDDQVMRGPDDIAAALTGRAPGYSAVVRFQRRGEVLSCRVTLAPPAAH